MMNLSLSKRLIERVPAEIVDKILNFEIQSGNVLKPQSHASSTMATSSNSSSFVADSAAPTPRTANQIRHKLSFERIFFTDDALWRAVLQKLAKIERKRKEFDQDSGLDSVIDILATLKLVKSPLLGQLGLTVSVNDTRIKAKVTSTKAKDALAASG